MIRIALIVVALLLLVTPRTGSTQQIQPNCSGTDEKACSGAERWVWDKVFAGQEADLDHCPNDLPYACVHRNILRPGFLRVLIMRGNDNAIVSVRGISIINATVCDPDPLNPSECAKPKPASVFFQTHKPALTCSPDLCAAPLDLRDLRFKGALELRNTSFRTDVHFGGAHLEQVLNLDDSIFDGDIDAYRLRIDGGLTMFHASVKGNLEADGLQTGGTTNFYQSTIDGSIHLRNAHIENDLDFGFITVTGPKDIPRPILRSSVELPRSAVDLSNAHVAGQVYATGVKVPNGNVDLSGVVVGGSVWAETDTEIKCGLTLERAHIGSDLMLGGGAFYQMDLTSARIDGALRLENNGYGTKWLTSDEKHFQDCKKVDHPLPPRDTHAIKSWLTLRNAQIFAIRDTPGGWPDCINLAGLTYARPPQDLAGKTNDGPDTQFRACDTPMAQESEPFDVDETTAPRPKKWWLNWLARDPQLTSQDYVQLASTLDVIGAGSSADDIRFGKRIFEIRQSGAIGQTANVLAMLFVGFGIGRYTMIALVWTLLFLAFGTWSLHRRLNYLRQSEIDATIGQALAQKGIGWCILATLQTILPLITLSKGMDDFLHTSLASNRPDTQPLYGWIAIGFAALAVMGLVLSGFLLQGLRNSFGL